MKIIMEELEKKVEEAAKKYIKDYYSEQIMPKCVKDAFINGAKSPEAKEYWQQEKKLKNIIFSDDIDTIGKCAKCGVEFHIHKLEQQGMYTEEDLRDAFNTAQKQASASTDQCGNVEVNHTETFEEWFEQNKKKS